MLIPWLAVDPDATLTVAGVTQPVARLLAELDPAERAGVRLTSLVLGPGTALERSDPGITAAADD